MGLACANLSAADTNLPVITNNVSSATINTNDPVEKEYSRILADDDAAQQEIDKWIRDAEAFKAKGDTQSSATLKLRIRQKLDVIKKEYDDFLQLHPNHSRARIAYGSFLNDSGDEDQAVKQWEKARELDPKNPATWNNLANSYGHNGPVKKAFEYYEKAIELKPDEPLYYQNLATHVYLFRKDAREYYQLTEQEVFDKSLALYRKAIKLDPENFILATDYAQSFYGTNPPRYKEGLKAWQDALKIARDDIERQGVHHHLARIEIMLGHYNEARQHLNAITDPMYNDIKATLTRNLDQAISKNSTNTAPSVKQVEPRQIQVDGH